MACHGLSGACLDSLSLCQLAHFLLQVEETPYKAPANPFSAVLAFFSS